MVNVRSRAIVLLTAATLSLASIALPAVVVGGEPDATPTATLDGKAIPLSDVSKYFCDDFDYPEIRCSTSKLIAETRATLVTLLTAIDYVTIFDFATYGGSYMHVSQDYAALFTIGWNDKVSSFKGRNSETGRFWTDWFNGGTSWSFCCNSQIPSLGSYDNTFSSVQRT